MARKFTETKTLTGTVKTVVFFPAKLRIKLEERANKGYHQSISAMVVNLVADALEKEGQAK
jgi:hypothetical protein